MLNNVPASVANAVRNTVLLHPNAFDCVVWRKHVTRVEIDPVTGQPSTMGENPTLGGMGVLKTEDEAEFEYVELGEGKTLFLGPYQPTSASERGTSPVPAETTEASVESLAEPGQSGSFEATVGDLVMLTLGMGIVLGYEVVDVIIPIGIAPYAVRKAVLQPRDYLHTLTPFAD